MVEAYYGQMLVRPDGTPYGTFIHFDLESRSIAADEIESVRTCRSVDRTRRLCG